MEFVTFENITKKYVMGSQEIIANDQISFSIKEKEFCVIVGPSGAGKTTILNLLGGMESCDSGSIIVDGSIISQMKERELTNYRRYDVGFVFQFYNLMPNLTALENIEIAVEISDNPLDPKETLKSVGLEDRFNNFPAQLSGGEQQRVSIARAIAKNPKILLCDEPTGALDSHSSAQVMKLFTDIHRTGQTILVVTHSVKTACYAGRVLFIRDGRLFNQLYRGDMDNEAFQEKISDNLKILLQKEGLDA